MAGIRFPKPGSRAEWELQRLQMEHERALQQAKRYARAEGKTAAQQMALQQAMEAGVPSEFLSSPQVRYDELRQRWQQEVARSPSRPDEVSKHPHGQAAPPSVGQKTWPSPRLDVATDRHLDPPRPPDLDRDGVLGYLEKRKNKWLEGIRLEA